VKVHASILPAAQRQLWETLGRTSQLGLVLYGGTAIALRFGHRESVDFDFFSERALDKQAVRGLSPLLQNAGVLQDEPETLTLAVPIPGADVPVKVSFFGGITFGRVGEPDVAESGVLIASPIDLLATKLKVMLERVEAKDYRDVATLVRSGVELSSGLAAAALLFRPAFQPSESLKALVYFRGGDLDTLSSAERRVLTEAAAAVRDLPVTTLRSGSLAPQSGSATGDAERHPSVGPRADRDEEP
jgi:hypothetical protein